MSFFLFLSPTRVRPCVLCGQSARRSRFVINSVCSTHSRMQMDRRTATAKRMATTPLSQVLHTNTHRNTQTASIPFLLVCILLGTADLPSRTRLFIHIFRRCSVCSLIIKMNNHKATLDRRAAECRVDGFLWEFCILLKGKRYVLQPSRSSLKVQVKNGTNKKTAVMFLLEEMFFYS